MEHRQVWGYISEAIADAPFEDRLYECHSISDALRIVREWSLPLYPVERHLLVAELERVQFMGDEESEIVQFILRQFPERPSNPHTLVVGRGFRGRGAVGVGVQRRDDHMVSRSGGMPWQQQQPLQHWPRGGGMPWQQQQPLQHWLRGGGMPRQQQQQQQWSCGVGFPHQHQRSYHAFPPARQARQQLPLQQPSRIPTIGGDGEDRSSPLSETFFGGDGGAVQEAPTASGNVTSATPLRGAVGARESSAVAEAPTSSAGTASTAVPAAAPATGGTVFPTTSVGGAARAPAPADETAALNAASTASGTVPSATPLREAVGARESSAGAASSDAVAEAAPLTGDTAFPHASEERADGQLTLDKSSAGTASSDAVTEAAPLTSDTVISDASVERADGQLKLDESSAGTAPSDAVAEAAPLQATLLPLMRRWKGWLESSP